MRLFLSRMLKRTASLGRISLLHLSVNPKIPQRFIVTTFRELLDIMHDSS